MTKDQAWKLRDLIPDSEMYPRVGNRFHTRRLAITSGKGGVGKSVIAVNFALLLAQRGTKTLLVDGDINLSKMPILTDTAPQFSYTDVRRGNKKLAEVIYEYQPNCSILPTGSGALEMVNPNLEIHSHFQRQFQEIDGRYDAMIVDTASGISSMVIGEISSCDEVMVTMTPDPTAIADAYAIIKILTFYYPHLPISVVLNMVESEDEAFETYKKFDLMAQKFLHREIPFLGFLAVSDAVRLSIKKQKPLALEDHGGEFIRNLQIILDRWLQSTPPHFNLTNIANN